MCLSDCAIGGAKSFRASTISTPARSLSFLGHGKERVSHHVEHSQRIFQYCSEGSSQNFTHRRQTKELSYGRKGVWTRFVVRSTVKKEKKTQSCCEACRVKSPKKCCESLSNLQGSGCTHANVVDQSQMSIALLKALPEGTHSSSTMSWSTPPARFYGCRKRKKKKK